MLLERKLKKKLKLQSFLKDLSRKMRLRTSTANVFMKNLICGVTIQILYSRLARSFKPMKSYVNWPLLHTSFQNKFCNKLCFYNLTRQKMNRKRTAYNYGSFTRELQRSKELKGKNEEKLVHVYNFNSYGSRFSRNSTQHHID